MRLHLSVTLALIVVTSTIVHASVPIGVKDYLLLRKKLMTQLPISTLRAEPQSYIGKVFEIRGTVTGFSKTGNEGNLIISTRNSGSFVVSTECLPFDNPGVELACLVKIGEESVYSLSDLRLVACTYDADLKRLDETRRKAAEDKILEEEARRAKDFAEPAGTTAKDKDTSEHIGTDQMIAIYKKAIKGFNRKLTDIQADTIARSVLGFSNKYKVDPRLVCAVILAESNFRIEATSRCGAQGLGQLMPGTAAGLGVDNAYDPVENIYGSVRYIRSMFDRIVGQKRWEELTWNDLALALAAYNAGPGAVKKHGGVPPYKETQNYVRKVVSIYKQLCGVK